MIEMYPKPKDSQWTDEQWTAIVSTGRDILVAAAAGSGKTAVLVERMIHKIVNEHVDVDRLLVVTFTNASAAEMRHRIGEALEKELQKKPASLHLRRQLSLLNRANISTIHSFCLEVVRKYYYLINIDPSFRIADTTETQIIQEEVLDALLESEYGQEDNVRFFDLVDRFTNDRSDAALQTIILKLHDFSRANANPDSWLDELVNRYKQGANVSIDRLPFISMLKEDISLQLEGAKAMLHSAMEITKLPGGPYPRAVNVEEDLAQIFRLEEALKHSWEETYHAMQSIDFPRAKTCKGDEFDKEIGERWNKLRNKAKKVVNDLKDELFTRKTESFLKDLEELAPVMETLVQVVRKYGQSFTKMKQEKGLVDFSDLEHLCLAVLGVENEDGTIIRSEAGIRYQSLFKEVMVDEYQDTNMVQETILKLVTKDEEQSGNMFMVGDVKQSIYRFRLAEPFLFLSKYKRFAKDAEQMGQRIDLNRNFRSRKEVLDATNYIFKQVMGEKVGEIDYDDQAELKWGAKDYPEHNQTSAELILINRESNQEAESDELDEHVAGEATFDKVELETAQVEAKFIAKRIKELVQSKFQIYDKHLKGMRAVTYRDFVILLRSMPWAPQFTEQFKQEGIPLYANLSTGYFEATEVAVMISLLKIIDNPYQDIPLASVLRSPIVGLDSNDLANIRIQQKSGTYFEALRKFCRESVETEGEEVIQQKVIFFLDMLQKWRSQAREGALSDLIWQLYRDTSFYDFVGGMPGGKQRQANLRALYDRSRQYESTSFRGLFRFLRFIERMQDRGEDLGAARALGEQEDVVRLMTIHSSKGLEFPIVFVAGLSKQFNMMDLNSSYLLDKEFGLATKFVHPKLRITYPTILQLALKRKARAQLIAEEMRVLYVALTRAKEKLYLLGTVKDATKSLADWNEHVSNEQWLLPDYVRANAKTYLDWIGPSLVRHNDTEVLRTDSVSAIVPEEITKHPAKLTISIIPVAEFLAEMEEEKLEEQVLTEIIKKREAVPIESDWKDTVKKQLHWQYNYATATSVRSKQSVSELKRLKEPQDPYADMQLVSTTKKFFLDRPKFVQKQKLAPAEIGTAVHAAMQHIDFQTDLVTISSVREQISKMVARELITEEQAKVVDVESIVTFFETPIGMRLRNAKKIQREVPFSFALEADELYGKSELAGETVLLQGVIDCLFEDEHGVVLLDYKTDTITGRIKKEEEEIQSMLRSRYEKQIAYYSKAVEQIWHKTVNEKYLFFFDGNRLINI
ncbi:helicase-exonuclease AddAB subunit AddA [Bacillus sp. FJAT-45066]|uniref:helicase-exonuclease AddAB subunit AddA n=1 Tax=Bacillus sp. FJAT-45066 TaxID=2011010 RepID=UPI000BB73A23|nr:helicase-exonuclease AddAB subunit AddA [Bacillus sp. FJAT-45066]